MENLHNNSWNGEIIKQLDEIVDSCKGMEKAHLEKSYSFKTIDKYLTLVITAISLSTGTIITQLKDYIPEFGTTISTVIVLYTVGILTAYRGYLDPLGKMLNHNKAIVAFSGIRADIERERAISPDDPRKQNGADYLRWVQKEFGDISAATPVIYSELKKKT